MSVTFHFPNATEIQASIYNNPVLNMPRRFKTELQQVH